MHYVDGVKFTTDPLNGKVKTIRLIVTTDNLSISFEVDKTIMDKLIQLNHLFD